MLFAAPDGGGLQGIGRRVRVIRQAQKSPKTGPVPARISTICLVGNRQETPRHMGRAKFHRSAICGGPIAQLMHRQGRSWLQCHPIIRAPVPCLPCVVAKRHVEPVAHHMDIAKARKTSREMRQEHMGVRLFPAPGKIAAHSRRHAVNETLGIRRAHTALPWPDRRKRVPQTDQQRVLLFTEGSTQPGGHGATQEVGGLNDLCIRRALSHPVRTLEKHGEPQVIERPVQSCAKPDTHRRQRGRKDAGARPPETTNCDMRIAGRAGGCMGFWLWVEHPVF